MPVSDLAIYSGARAVGFLANALFVGGNIYISGLFIPHLNVIPAATDRVNLFCAHFESGKKLYASLGLIASVAYGTAAYYAPTDHLQMVMGVCSGLTFAVVPYTVAVILPTVKAIFGLKTSGDVGKLDAEGDKLIDKWAKLHLSRMLIALIPLLIAAKEIAE